MPTFEAVDSDPFADTGPQIVSTSQGDRTVSRENGVTRIAPVRDAKFEPVDHDPFAGPSYASDIGKSIVSGLEKGVTSLVGLPGTVKELVGKGVTAAGDAIGLPRASDEQVAQQPNLLPNVKTVQDAAQQVVGPFHQPETTPGKYAETIAEFAPAALAGPGGIVRKLVTQAAIPGAASEAAGQATAGTPYEPYARFGGALVGGIGGSIAGAPSSAMRSLQKELPPYVTAQHVDRAEALMQHAQQRGIELTWPEALSRVTGKPVLTDMQRILESANHTRSDMQNVLGPRAEQFDQAGLNEFDRISPAAARPSSIGPANSQSAQEHVAGVRGSINKASEPYYQAAESVMLTPAEMSHVKAIPGWTEARDAVRKDPMLNRYVAHLPDNSVAFLNEVKKVFDQNAQNAASKFNPARNHQVQASNEAAASALKQIGELKSSDYAIALQIQSQARKQFLEPLLQGPLGRLAKKDVTTRDAINALFPRNPLPNSHGEIAEAVSALATKRPAAAAQLVRAHVESVFNEATRSLSGGPNSFGAAKFAAWLVGNPQQRENLRAALEALPQGQARWQSLNKFLEIAEATGTRQAIGSKTAFNAQELERMSKGGLIAETAKLGASPSKWMSAANNIIGGWKYGQNMSELFKVITDPNSGGLLRQAASAPKGREMEVTLARLLAQSVQSNNPSSSSPVK